MHLVKTLITFKNFLMRIVLISFFKKMFTPTRLVESKCDNNDVVMEDEVEKDVVMQEVIIVISSPPQDTNYLSVLKKSEARQRPHAFKRRRDSLILLKHIHSIMVVEHGHMETEITRRSLYIAVSICEFVMSKPTNGIQPSLMFETALWMAIKFDSNHTSLTDGLDFILGTQCCFKNRKRTTQRLIETEILMFQLCDYCVNFTEADLFIEWFFYIHGSNVYNEQAKHASYFICDLNLGRYMLLEYLASEIAAACIMNSVDAQHYPDVTTKLEVKQWRCIEVCHILNSYTP